MRRFEAPWGTAEVYAAEPVPPELRTLARDLAPLGPRFRPALLRFRIGEGRRAPYAAVWPPDRPVPRLTGGGPLTAGEARDLVFAEVQRLTCRVCGTTVRGVYPGGALGGGDRAASAHRPVDGCAACGSSFAASRVQALAVLPPAASGP
ncbi:hypothetical protein CLV63_107152 [Murinocardiopsis flavida]|uniref:Uncharacterized protein n=1 Tax=Murinocardiopsis flavida TaxID=645275 RepID=A0A2P8DKM9_9ACTN|nr:hypothetical protein [Murinocardiopsis flavida]PSK97759.1 hypothetical protein CLV63_107152 [Murinocardiopsis flavida]